MSTINVLGGSLAGASPLDAILPDTCLELSRLRLLGILDGSVPASTAERLMDPRNWKATALNGAASGGLSLVHAGVVIEPAASSTTVVAVPGALRKVDPAGTVTVGDHTKVAAADANYETTNLKRISAQVSDGGEYWLSSFDFSAVPSGATINYVRVKQVKVACDQTAVITATVYEDAVGGTGVVGDDAQLTLSSGSLAWMLLGPFAQSTGWSAAQVKASSFGVRLQFDADAGSMSPTAYVTRLDLFELEVNYTEAA